MFQIQNNELLRILKDVIMENQNMVFRNVCMCMIRLPNDKIKEQIEHKIRQISMNNYDYNYNLSMQLRNFNDFPYELEYKPIMDMIQSGGAEDDRRERRERAGRYSTRVDKGSRFSVKALRDLIEITQ